MSGVFGYSREAVRVKVKVSININLIGLVYFIDKYNVLL